MICLQIKGRMGNHLFQYAFARKIARMTGENIAIDWHEVTQRHSVFGDGWENSFDDSKIGRIPECSIEEIANPMQLRILKLNKKVTYHRFFKVFLPIVRFFSQFFGVYVCLDTNYFPFIYYGAKNKIIYGYFESDRYFPNSEQELQSVYCAKTERSVQNEILYKKIQDTESVCVTIRRGDFYSEQNRAIYGVCDDNYFQRGIAYIRSKCPNIVLFFFSDDIEWVKNNVDAGGEAYYESGKDSLWEKLQLMSGCKHFVISNSTFSWWAQYLSSNPSKIVVAPKHWRTNDKRYDIKENNWSIL